MECKRRVSATSYCDQIGEMSSGKYHLQRSMGFEKNLPNYNLNFVSVGILLRATTKLHN